MLEFLDNFFLFGDPAATPETGVYQLPLVILSYVVASFASYTAITMGLQLADVSDRIHRQFIRIGGAFAFGAGIWAMHFIGMLSYDMDMVITYDAGMTFLSMLIAIIMSYFVMGMVGKTKVGSGSLVGGAILLGSGICLMHFIGMAAMQMDGQLLYKPGLFALSAVIAMSMSAIALYLAFILLRDHSRYASFYQILAGLILGAAICGMHYTAMLGAVFVPFAECRYNPNQSHMILAIVIAIITGIVLLLSLLAGTQRKRMIEGKLSETEARLRAVFDSSIDAMIGMDENGYVTQWNKQAEVMYDWPSDHMVGKKITDIIIPDHLQYLYEGNFKEYLENRVGQRIEATVINRHGREFPIESIITTYKLKGRNYYTAFVRDITEKKKSQSDSALLASIVTSSDDPIISETLQGIINSWNKAAEKLFGYTAEEAIGCHISLIIPENRVHEEEDILNRIEQGHQIEQFETLRRSKDGREIDISLTVSPLRSPEGVIVGASKIIRDITERRRAEKEIEEANRRKEEFLTHMSHELRTPMNVVVGLSDILGRTEPLSDKQKHFIDTLKSSAVTLLSLINDLLDFSKLEQDGVQFEEIDFNLLELMAQVVSLMHVKAKEKKLDLDLHYEPGIPYKLKGDPLRLQQVLINLISNAVKFTHTGKITVAIACEEGMDIDHKILKFVVSDTGIGIDKKQLDTIFDKFTQADASITRRYGGSGLGLSIVKALVEKQNGTVSVVSKPGQGSDFTIRIPFAVNKREEIIPITPAHERKPNTSKGLKGKVLFVEDYAPNTLVGTAFLEQFGYEFDTVTNGREAFDYFCNGQYDVILMDIQMPEMDGMETTRRIRAWEKERNANPTPIIAMTAHVLEHNRQAYAEVGMNDFIPKPFDAEDLERKLARYAQTN